MPIPAYQRYRLVVSGTIVVSQTWSCGLMFTAGTSDFPTQAQMDTWTAAAATLFHTWWTGSPGVGGLASADTVLNACKGYSLPPGTDKADLMSVAPITPTNGTGSLSLPTQTSAVASLRSSNPGRSGRGRIYVPCTGAVMATHQLTSGEASDLAASTAALITGLNAVPLGVLDLTCVVASGTGGGAHPITHVIADSRVDIQRRRANEVTPFTKFTDAVT